MRRAPGFFKHFKSLAPSLAQSLDTLMQSDAATVDGDGKPSLDGTVNAPDGSQYTVTVRCDHFASESEGGSSLPNLTEAQRQVLDDADKDAESSKQDRKRTRERRAANRDKAKAAETKASGKRGSRAA